MHSASGGKTLETWDTMAELKQQGKIKYAIIYIYTCYVDYGSVCCANYRSIGVANFNIKHLTELKKARPDNIPAGENFYQSFKSYLWVIRSMIIFLKDLFSTFFY